jgi:membrane protein DedA with SNARE-associated domain
MVETVFVFLKDLATGVIGTLGYPGVVLLMALESACVPIPSEVIMPFAGFLAFQGKFAFHLAALLGAFGELLGACLAFWVGGKGGRPMLAKYGRYILMRQHEIDVADYWFRNHGPWMVFFGRLMPFVRTYISLPAGMHGMRFGPFAALSFAGSLLWCYALTYAGFRLADKWDLVRNAMRRFDTAILIVVGVAIVWFVWSRVRSKQPISASEDQKRGRQ